MNLSKYFVLLLFFARIQANLYHKGHVHIASHGLCIFDIDEQSLFATIEAIKNERKTVANGWATVRKRLNLTKNGLEDLQMEGILSEMAAIVDDGAELRSLLDPHVHSEKKKRNVFAIIFSALGLGMSVYNAFRISAVDSKLNAFMSYAEKEFKEISNAIDMLKNELLILGSKIEVLELVGPLRSRISNADRALSKLRSGVDSLLRGRVPYELLGAVRISDTIKRIRTEATALNLNFELSVQEFIRLPAKIRPESNTIHVEIAIPLTAVTLDLLVLRPLPIKLNNTLFAIVESSSNHIGINRERNRFLEISALELSQCFSTGHEYFCVKPFINLASRFEENCLSAIYNRDYTSALSICEKRFITLDNDHVSFYPKNANNFGLLLGRDRQCTIDCGYKLKDSNYNRGLNEIIIRPGCTAVVGDSKLIHLPEYAYHENIVVNVSDSFVVPTKLFSIFNETALNFQRKMNKVEFKPKSFFDFERDYKGSVWLIVKIVLGSSCVLLLLILCFILFRK